jgi:hypothetical protein
MVEYLKDAYKLDAAAASAKAEEASEGYLASVLKGPADQVSWCGLNALLRRDAEAATRRWEEVKEQALYEVRCGHRAAKAMEGYGSHAWTRAQFLAIRRDLMEGWQPRNGIERQLIDMMAQAQTANLYWLDMLTLRSSCGSGRKREGGRWEPETVSDAEAVEQAAAMVERFQGMFVRALKALRELRRQVPVVVQNAGQVNVGDKQVNINASDRQTPTAAAMIP